MSRRSIAKILLSNKAVTLNAKEPYAYASGIRSPIYCDNRVLLGNCTDRKIIVNSFINAAKALDFDIVAGTSTAGIPWAAWIADKLKKPMCYIRTKAKDHGMGKRIEGADVSGKKIIIIEDLVSTGGSSISAVDAARGSGAVVMGVIAIFTYEFEKSISTFKDAKCPLAALTDFSTLIRVAKSLNYISKLELNMARKWNHEPVDWGPKHGFQNAVKGDANDKANP